MQISARIINNYIDINHFDYGNEWTIRAGEPNTLYFQLIDLDMKARRPGDCCGHPDGLRHLVQGTPAGVIVTFPSIDDAKKIEAIASNPSPLDTSVWSIQLSYLQVPRSGNVMFRLAEAGAVRHFNVLNAISVEHPQEDGSC
jgi:hypothetical protein